jgi:hypothetical protein
MAPLGRFYVPFVGKAREHEDGSVTVFGKVTDETVDLDGQIVDPGWARQAMAEWFARWANIRAMHQPLAVGVGTRLETREDGIYLESRIVDPAEARKVREGVYKGYSIGIKGPVVEPDPRAPNGRICGGTVVETSIVDHPANESARFTLTKRLASGDWADAEVLGRVVRREEVEQMSEMTATLCASCGGVSCACAAGGGSQAATDAEVTKALPREQEGGRKHPPRGYPEDPEEYADPRNFKYPIDRRHIRPAIQFYNAGKGRESYSAEEWRTVGQRIVAAANRLLGGGYRLVDGRIETPAMREEGGGAKAAAPAAWLLHELLCPAGEPAALLAAFPGAAALLAPAAGGAAAAEEQDVELVAAALALVKQLIVRELDEDAEECAQLHLLLDALGALRAFRGSEEYQAATALLQELGKGARLDLGKQRAFYSRAARDQYLALLQKLHDDLARLHPGLCANLAAAHAEVPPQGEEAQDAGPANTAGHEPGPGLQHAATGGALPAAAPRAPLPSGPDGGKAAATGPADLLEELQALRAQLPGLVRAALPAELGRAATAEQVEALVTAALAPLQERVARLERAPAPGGPLLARPAEKTFPAPPDAEALAREQQLGTLMAWKLGHPDGAVRAAADRLLQQLASAAR